MTTIADLSINLGFKVESTLDSLFGNYQTTLLNYINDQTPQLTTAFNQFVDSVKSPFTETLPLMNPFHVLILSILYLVGVGVGIQIMKLRQPASVKLFSMLHNTFLVSLSFYMGFSIVTEAISQGYGLFGNPVDKSFETGHRMVKLIWLFYFSKVFEFVDTFIMVLKKNNRQISFLHLYHHTSIFGVWWLVTLWAPNGEAYFSAFLNSFIHVVMYGYYLCSALGINQVLFIKKYITMMQMTQFCCMMVQAMYNMFNDWDSKPNDPKKYPLALSIVLFFYMQTMLALFANFFMKMTKASAKKKTL